MKRTKIVNANILIKVIASIIICWFLFSMGIGDLSYLTLAIINTIITVNAIFSKESEPYSLYKIVNFFILFFFVLANAIQFSTGTNVTSISIHFSTDEYFLFQILVFFILCFFNVPYWIFRKHIRIADYSRGRLYAKEKTLIIASLLASTATVLSYRHNLFQLFFRGVAEELAVDGGSASNVEMTQMSSLLLGTIRYIPTITYLISLQCQNTTRKTRLLLFLLFVIITFPTALSRNTVAMLWLPVLLIKFPILRQPNIFMIALLGGLLVVFPFLDIFRHFSGSIEFKPSLDFMNSMHFDASQMFMAELKSKIVTFGKQLLGALLFFVPRSIWHNKPIGSGAFLAERYGASFSNVSMPYFAEGYMNFGILGVFIFTLAIAYFSAFWDKKYWASNRKQIMLCKPFCIIYLFLIGAITFILRGDLMSSFAYTFSLVVVYWFIYKLTVNEIIV